MGMKELSLKLAAVSLIADVMKIERSTVHNSLKRVNEYMQTEFGYMRKLNKYIEFIEQQINVK